MSHTRMNQSGLTIVEVIIGLTVFALLLSTIGLITRSTQSLNDQSVEVILANGIATEKIEALRSAGFVNLPTDGTVVDFTDELPDTFEIPRSATYTVTDISNGTLTNSLKQVDIEIEFTQGQLEQVNYSSFIGELGVGQ